MKTQFNFKKISAYFLLALIFSVLSVICFAGTAHNNQLHIQKNSPQSLQLEFAINPCQMLHQWLAPTIPFVLFLQKYTVLSDDIFHKELSRAVRKFESESFVLQASGTRESMKLAEIPTISELKKLLQQNLLIIDLPSSLDAHLEPIALRANLKTKAPLQRVQLFISTTVFPIQVRHHQDVFWLTTQIPMSLLDF